MKGTSVDFSLSPFDCTHSIAIAIAQSNSGAVVKDCIVVTIMAKHVIDYLEAPNRLCFSFVVISLAS
jgi:hypothetical protein